MNRTTRGKLGGVLQAGLDFASPAMLRAMNPTMGLLRGVVVNTYVTDDPFNSTSYRVECDVLVVRSNLVIPRVAVSQPSHGVNHAEPWIPRESTRNIVTNGALSLTPRSATGVPGTPSTLPSDLDGDHVLLAPIENDHGKYVILRALTHPRTKRLILGPNGEPASQIGWDEGTPAAQTRGKPARHEKYTSHQGTEVRVNGKGDYLIDTVGATQDAVNETPSNDAGHVRIRVKETMRFTVEMDGLDVLEVYKQGSQIRIDLGENATERLVLGDSFMPFFNTHVHPSGTGPTGAPIQQMTAAQHLSDLVKTRQS